MEDDKLFLTEDQIRAFVQDGVLVVDNILSQSQLDGARSGLTCTLSSYGVDASNLAATGHALQSLSSTNGSGGVLDIFYPGWKLDVATNPRLFHVTCQLWEATCCHDGETKEEFGDSEFFKWHPHGGFDCGRGYMYIDRIGYRLPTQVAEQIGSDLHEETNSLSRQGKKRAKPIQRSLTPHLDCCPEKMWEGNSKWRPIQCFVSLTDNLHSNTGGFEAAPGFHRTFHNWAQARPPTTITRKVNGSSVESSFPAPCIGDYTHIRPKEDHEVMDRVRHVPVRAGSAVFWDYRIPHANAYRNDGTQPRAVVYCSFLPDVEVNRGYVRNQLSNYRSRRRPTDQWINIENNEWEKTTNTLEESANDRQYQFTVLGRKLIGIDTW